MADLPEFIYRIGTRTKDLALTKRADWFTGFSFSTETFASAYLTLSVQTLIANGFVVKLDTGLLTTIWWSGEPYIEPNSGEQLVYPENHISVWYPDKAFWDAWYEADLKMRNTRDISTQLAFFALAKINKKEA